MTELKTLEDYRRLPIDNSLPEKTKNKIRDMNRATDMLIGNLKQEVVKWINKLDKDSLDIIKIAQEEGKIDYFDFARKEVLNNEHTIRFIKHFFNIKDEDLDGFNR